MSASEACEAPWKSNRSTAQHEESWQESDRVCKSPSQHTQDALAAIKDRQDASLHLAWARCCKSYDVLHTFKL